MKAVIQRVKKASVEVKNEIVGTINQGLLIYLGIGQEDSEKEVDYFVNKITNLRIFEDDQGKMNLSALDLNFDVLVVSQFTLYGDVKKGFRPNFQKAADKDKAVDLYDLFCDKLSKSVKVQKGIFQAMMNVESINDGPVTIIMES